MLKRSFYLFLCVLLIDIVAMAIHWHVAAGIVSDAAPQTNQTKAVAVVFFGSYGDETRDRVATGVQLLEDGVVDSMLFVGGARSGSSSTGAEWMLSLAEQHIAADRLRVGAGSKDTVSNLLAMCKALDAGRRDQQVVLVSDALHLARIGWMLEAVDCLPGEVVGVALQPSPYDPPWPERVARVHAD